MWALLAACTGEPVGDGSTPARTWDGDFLIGTVLIDCDGVSEWTYEVETIGWGDEVTVDVVGRGPGYVWTEHHPLVEVDWGEGWALFRAVLDQGTAESDYAPGEATILACEAKSYVTYGIAAWRYDGELQECVAYGVDPVGEFPDCANWGQGH